MKILIYILFLIIILGSCASFPSDQLSLDFTDQEFPIMLNNKSDLSPTKTFSFESGYQRLAITTTSSYGGRSVSSTAVVSSNINKPLNNQLNNVFIQTPQWLTVTKLMVHAYKYESIGRSEDQYLFILDIAIASNNSEEVQ